MATNDVMLYGHPGAEVMHLDAATVWEVEYEPYLDEDNINAERLIEEWTSTPAGEAAPRTDWIIEWVIDTILDETGADDGEPITQAGKDPEVIAAFEHARSVLSSKITYRMAEKKVRTMKLTFDAEGEPLLDGEPLYKKAVS